jgi:hypothetical protein
MWSRPRLVKPATLRRHTIKASLVKPVARSLHRRMGNTVACKLCEKPVQRHRIGCRQRTVFAPPGRDDAGCAEHCRLFARMRPDLAQERSDRGLARSSGHRRHHPWLRSEKGCRHARQSKTRIVCPQHRRDRPRKSAASPAATIASGTFGPGLVHEPCAVRLHPGKGKKQIARLDLTAVGRQTGDRTSPGPLDGW